MKNSFFSGKFNKQYQDKGVPGGSMFFVTFRLADAIVQSDIAMLQVARQQWQAIHINPLDDVELQAYETLFNARIESWLDQGLGGCILKRPECMSILVDTLCYYDQDIYQLDHWVVMSNHVHALFIPTGGVDVEDIVQNWKQQSGNEINKFTGFFGNHLWHYENIIRQIKSEDRLKECRDYIVKDAARDKDNSYLSTQKAVLLINDLA